MNTANTASKNQGVHELNCFEGPYTIGLTGNIATGKTTVGNMLVDLGAELIDADQVAHRVILPGGSAYQSVKHTFGEEILTPEGLIDRRILGAIVFSDPEALRLLESIIHPPVIACVNQRIEASRAQVVVIEAIKLLESGMGDDYDAIWVTTCPEELQLARLEKIRLLEHKDAVRRLQAQPPQQEKIERADVVIDTSGSIEKTRVQVKKAWRIIPLDRRLGDGITRSQSADV
jgi:dephospho-CoA kinase